MKTVLLIDGHNLAYRSFHQPSLKKLKRPDGKKSGVFYGFLAGIQKLMTKFRPYELIVVFDGDFASHTKAKHYEGYKAGRKQSKRSFRRQIYDLREFLFACGVRVLSIPGVEADDILFHLAKYIKATKNKSIIVTADHDMFQCINKHTRIWNDRDKKMWDKEQVFEKYKCKPKYVPVYQALAGKKSNDVTGVRGIGPQRAFEFLEYLERHKGDINKTCHKTLTRKQQNEFVRSLYVTQIQRNIPVIQYIDKYVRLRRSVNPQVAKKWLKLYACSSILSKFPTWVKMFREK